MSGSVATWLPGIVAMAIGLAAALLAAATVVKRRIMEPDRDTAVDDLEERTNHAVALLRDLEGQKSRIPADQYSTQRAELERRAAEAMRERDALLGRRATAATRREPEAAPRARALLWGAGILVTSGILFALILRTGVEEPGSQSGAPARDEVHPEIKEIMVRLQNDPSDMEALVRGGHIMLGQMALPEARQFIERALQLDPEHPESLVHYAVLLAAEGKREEGLRRLDAVLASSPELAEGWFVRGMLGVQTGNEELKRESFTRFIALSPDGPLADQVRRMLGTETTTRKSGVEPSPVWMAKCANCHGDHGRGDTRLGRSLGLPNMRTPAWQASVTNAAIRQAIQEGVTRTRDGRTRRMMPFRDLTDRQVAELVALIRSWSDEGS